MGVIVKQYDGNCNLFVRQKYSDQTEYQEI